ncbi:MAG: hypothetical protein OEY59_13260 [Deltaproteobacteria bacterium]|nr:hypothetical protein [Deltaproteobacteria bacterium]
MAHTRPGASTATITTPSGWPDLVAQGLVDFKLIPDKIPAVRIEAALQVASERVLSWFAARDVSLNPLTTGEELSFESACWWQALANLAPEFPSQFDSGSVDMIQIKSQVDFYTRNAKKSGREIQGYGGPGIFKARAV